MRLCTNAMDYGRFSVCRYTFAKLPRRATRRKADDSAEVVVPTERRAQRRLHQIPV